MTGVGNLLHSFKMGVDYRSKLCERCSWPHKTTTAAPWLCMKRIFKNKGNFLAVKPAILVTTVLLVKTNFTVHTVHAKWRSKFSRADLEFAALDQLEGEDCSSLLSKGVTHWRHAARCDATYILQPINASMLGLHTPTFHPPCMMPSGYCKSAMLQY